MICRTYPYPPVENLNDAVTAFVQSFPVFCLLNSHRERAGNFSKYLNYELLAAAGIRSEHAPQTHAFQWLEEYTQKNTNWLFGHLGYDLKNETESGLNSSHPDYTGFENMYFFEPEIVIIICCGGVQIYSYGESDCDQIYQEICHNARITDSIRPVVMNSRMNRDEYGKKFRALKNHIQLGDIYEITFCREFFAETLFDPVAVYRSLCSKIPSPFSALYRIRDRYLVSASPERYLMKRGRMLMSQPMKGTYPRHPDSSKDLMQKERLFNDPKERSENVMITDLVRNDLSRTAASGSVNVSELFGVYTFPNVHQMVSTVVANLKEGCHFTEAIRSSFPMGSMTGAPKRKAMELIENFETSRRGLFSGSVGYISPEGDFDFNVVIRSFLYNAANRYLSLSAGGAITAMSDEESEFAETELKASGLMNLLK